MIIRHTVNRRIAPAKTDSPNACRTPLRERTREWAAFQTADRGSWAVLVLSVIPVTGYDAAGLTMPRWSRPRHNGYEQYFQCGNIGRRDCFRQFLQAPALPCLMSRPVDLERDRLNRCAATDRGRRRDGPATRCPVTPAASPRADRPLPLWRHQSSGR